MGLVGVAVLTGQLREDVLHLVYITDTDLDGLSDRLEQPGGTRIDRADTDGDGLDDALESYGWYTNLASPPCDVGDDLVLVFSDPRIADTDGVDDGEEFASCSSPTGEVRVDLGEDRLARAGSRVRLTATVSNALDDTAVRTTWMQLEGPPVGTLPNERHVEFIAPADVTTLVFRATVKDTERNDQIASDEVRLIVVRDPERALFVEGPISSYPRQSSKQGARSSRAAPASEYGQWTSYGSRSSAAP